jgi:tRNA (adenine22-N1)-methyltransferase
MKNFSLSPRLQAVLDCVEKCAVLADIGTDHAYLPIEACRQNFCEKAIACDVNDAPLEIAKNNIHDAELSHKIETRLGDGLEPIHTNEADCIVMAGMGGMKIIEILKESREKITNAKLILQPQHDLEELRRFLHAHSYNILEEKLTRERRRFYVIITARREEKIIPYTDAEYFLGKFSCDEKNFYFRDLHNKISKYFNNITDENEKKSAETRLKWLEVTE